MFLVCGVALLAAAAVGFGAPDAEGAGLAIWTAAITGLVWFFGLRRKIRKAGPPTEAMSVRSRSLRGNLLQCAGGVLAIAAMYVVVFLLLDPTADDDQYFPSALFLGVSVAMLLAARFLKKFEAERNVTIVECGRWFRGSLRAVPNA
jgi:hypothetical protein